MKLWRIIWAIYVLALSAVPCDAYCQDETTSATEQATWPISQDHAHEKGCSPFCLCAACPGFTLPQPPQLMAVAMLNPPIVVAALPRYQSPQGCEVPSRIWQPPRLG